MKYFRRLIGAEGLDVIEREDIHLDNRGYHDAGNGWV